VDLLVYGFRHRIRISLVPHIYRIIDVPEPNDCDHRRRHHSSCSKSSFLSQLNPLGHFDPTPMSFAASGVIIVYGYLRLKLFDLVPVALDILIERVPDAMFVLDPAGHIIDANPAAERLVAIFEGHLVGRHLCNVLPVNLADHELCTGMRSEQL
jgi:PAS domain-containing protein